MAAAEENPKGKLKSRLIVRLAYFLVAHNVFVSVLCCFAGFVALLLLPILAKNTYVSENALMPGSANPMFSGQDVLEANKFVNDILDRSIRFKNEFSEIEISNLIRQHMEDVGAEVYYHKFRSPGNHFRPLRFFSSTPNTVTMQNESICTSYGVNSVGIIRAPRGDGKESIVLVTPYNSENIGLSDALSLGLASSVFSLFSRVSWLAKDIVWLASDSRYGEYDSVATWLKDYHSPVFYSDSENVDAGMCFEENVVRERDNSLARGRESNVFKRAGTMAAAFVFKVVEKVERDGRDSLTIFAEASNGQMPNLDLINIVHYLAVHRQGLRVKVGTIGSLLNSAWLKFVSDILQGLVRLASSLNPKWKFDITSADYTDGTATLASSMYYQALGVPTGSHGAFRDYQVDAITLELSPTLLKNENIPSAFLLRSGRLIEGVVRSVNNLLEKFHQSFFLYLLTSPDKFVSVGVYMIALALLIIPLPIAAAALFSGSKKPIDSTDMMDSNSSCSDTKEVAALSWKWLHSVKVVFMVHLWAVTVSLLPSLISQFPHCTSSTSMLSWVAVSLSILLILYLILGSPYLHAEDGEWKTLKVVMIAAVFVGLGLMSNINFSTAQIGAILLVPMCLIVRPLKVMKSVAGLRAVLLACNLVLGVVGFPPATLLILKGLSNGFEGAGIGDFWEWAEFLWAWNSATYLYIFLVHLPCWVLCIHILLHP